MRRRTAAPRRRQQTGAALILALLIAGLLLASSAVSVEAFLLTMRTERRGIDRIVDFHLADTMLTLCERRVAHAYGADAHSAAGAGAGAGAASPADAAADVMDAVGAAASANDANNADRATDRPAPGPAVTDPITVLHRAMARQPEPTGWQDAGAFDAHGSHPSRIVLPATLAALGPHQPHQPHRPLVCLVETWIDAPEAGRVLLLTAHVPAAQPGAGSGTWLQSVVMLTASRLQRHWRAVAEPPSPFS
ncbi:MAG: hypothetical protein ACRYHA_13505 [Janthinobacterium lividum]